MWQEAESLWQAPKVTAAAPVAEEEIQ